MNYIIKRVAKHAILFSIIILCIIVLSGCTKDIVNKSKNETKELKNEIQEETSTDPYEFLEETYKEGESYITSKDQLELKNTDGSGKTYSFVYNNEKYTAIYTKDNWQIKNSYKIRNKKDITLICEALTDIHPIHGKDMKSYRTAEDMMDEWVIHNIAYDYLPEGNSWKIHTRDVDLNPADQGKSLKEMFEDRLNK